MKSFLRTFSGALALAALVSTTQVAHAQSAERDPSATILVRYDDLNLSAPAGVSSLTRRIQNAATSICSAPSSNPLDALRRRACVRDATHTALAQVRWPQK
jgi:UrcA family protein